MDILHWELYPTVTTTVFSEVWLLSEPVTHFQGAGERNGKLAGCHPGASTILTLLAVPPHFVLELCKLQIKSQFSCFLEIWSDGNFASRCRLFWRSVVPLHLTSVVALSLEEMTPCEKWKLFWWMIFQLWAHISIFVKNSYFSFCELFMSLFWESHCHLLQVAVIDCGDEKNNQVINILVIMRKAYTWTMNIH